jgi:hypothetical protein
MRYITGMTCLVLATLVTGCTLFGPINNPHRGDHASDTQAIHALNVNAARCNALECADLEIECKQAGQTITPMGRMVCQKPRNFYLQGKVAGNPVVQMGSNSEEFWYWIRPQNEKAPPYLFHCSWDNYQRGMIRGMKLPFQPDWLMEVLGMGTFDEDPKHVKVTTKDNVIEIEQQTTSPTGEAITKLTVIDRKNWKGDTPCVKEHQLLDKSGKLICSATVLETQVDPSTRAVYPMRVEVKWPAEQLEMRFTLRDAKVLKDIGQDRSQALFSRKQWNGETFDLARGQPDGASASDRGVQGTTYKPASPPPPPGR